MKFLYSILIFFYATAAWATEEFWPGIIPVGSEYKDEITGQPTRINGSAMLVHDKRTDKYYVYTASHVASGENIVFGNHVVKVKGKIIDSDNDLMMLEVENPNLATAFLQEYGNLSIDEKYGAIFRTNCDHSLYCVPDLYGVSGKKFTTGKRFDNSGVGTRIVSDIKIYPGMSGTPLIFRGQCIGFASYFDRRFVESYFVESNVAHTLWEKYSSGTRDAISGTKHILRNGLLYTKYKDGTLEILPESIKAGNANSSDGGNANSSDGGSSNTDGDVYKKYQIQSGIYWKGKDAAIAFDTKYSSTPIFANRAALELIDQHPIKSQAAAIPPGADIQKNLLARLQQHGLYAGANRASFIAADIAEKEIIGTSDTSGSGATKAESILSFPAKNRMRLFLRVPPSKDIALEFNEQGDLLSINSKQVNQKFRPVIELNEMGIKAIDLRNFYFSNIENIDISMVASAFKAEPAIRLINSTGQVYNFQYRWWQRKSSVPAAPAADPAQDQGQPAY